MIVFLRLLFALVLASMLWVTIRAGQQQSLGEFARSATFREPWVVATLFDAYWSFITVYVWIAWKEQSLAARLLWFVAVVLLGNLATAVYFLVELFRVPASGPSGPALHAVFAERRPGRVVLPAVLAALGLAVYAVA